MTTTPNQPDRESAVRLLEYGLQSPATMFYSRPHELASALRIVLDALAFRDADRAGEGERVAVPRTPTIDMMGAGIEEWGILDDCEAEVSRIWEAMVNAAPATPLLDDETVERCIAAVESERLECPTDMDDDVAYERALDDAIAAIRALKGTTRG